MPTGPEAAAIESIINKLTNSTRRNRSTKMFMTELVTLSKDLFAH